MGCAPSKAPKAIEDGAQPTKVASQPTLPAKSTGASETQVEVDATSSGR